MNKKKDRIYKTVDLFGNEQIQIIKRKTTSNKTLFTDYDGFVEKFKPKKTTDDCYTPTDVMDLIINYVNEKYPLENKQIIRPFYPDGDFENIDYPRNAVVIDNPPFSIISKICKFYIERDIKFFLFCPHLTAFGSDIDATHIIASADITYENGAKVKTAFVSNLFGDLKIIGDAELCEKFKQLQEKNKVNLPKYKYPNNIITVSKISYCVEKGVSIAINKKDVKHYRAMDAQKKHKKGIFGSGFLVADTVADAIAKATAKAKAIDKKEDEKEDNVIVWELSPKELQIIETLG
jgi:hypothetical protein